MIGGKESCFNSSYDSNTQSIEISFKANKADEICIEITGDNLITDNENVLPRCYEILRHSNISIYKKIEYRDTMLGINYEEKPARLKLGGAASEDDQELYDAICEMLSIDKREHKAAEKGQNVE